MPDKEQSPSVTEGKPFPPRGLWVPRVFRRAEGFYIIDLPADDDLAEHARLNPGTLRIETVSGEQLWPPPLASVASPKDSPDAP